MVTGRPVGARLHPTAGLAERAPGGSARRLVGSDADANPQADSGHCPLSGNAGPSACRASTPNVLRRSRLMTKWSRCPFFPNA